MEPVMTQNPPMHARRNNKRTPIHTMATERMSLVDAAKHVRILNLDL